MSRTRPIYPKRTIVRTVYPAAKRQTTVRTRKQRGMSNVRTGGFVGSEMKYFDQALALTQVSDLANLSDGMLDPTATDCLNCPELGSGPTNRIGRFIQMHSIHISGTIKYVPNGAKSAVLAIPDVFIALVLDTQTNKAQMASNDCYTNPSANQDLVTSPFRNLEYTKRFRVLKKMVIRAPDLQQSTDFGGTPKIMLSGKQIHFQINKKLFGKKVGFVGNSSPNTIGNIDDNSLHLIAFANSNTGTSDVAIQIGYNCRLRFYE